MGHATIRRVAVLRNPGAGAETAAPDADWLRAAFAAVGVEARVDSPPPETLEAAARAAVAAGAQAVVAAGGDGTVSAVAAALVDGPVPLGVLPVGTFNHFARDAGLPSAVEECVAVVARGRSRAVDVGDVNGRVFVNNCSLGIYTHVVRSREVQRARAGRGKRLAWVLGSLQAFSRFPLLNATLVVDGVRSKRRTPFVMVGNNAYDISLFALNTRQRLDAGRLGVYVASPRSRLALARLVARALYGNLHVDAEFEILHVPEAVVSAGRHNLVVAIDGELSKLRSPLRFRSRPGALRVLVPEPAA